jgi:hypothetical protein
MDATTIISAVGVLFAAIAAGAALKTVRLTRQIQREADVRRALTALINISDAATALHTLSSGDPVSQLHDRFREGQAELRRAFALSVSLEGTWALEAIDELETLIDRLLTAEPTRDQLQIITDAERARELLSSRPPPKLIQMPIWWRRAVVAHRLKTSRTRSSREAQ